MPLRSVHRGDGGETQLLSGQRVPKDDPRIECVGALDELSSCLGVARAGLEESQGVAGVPPMIERLRRIQRDLYYLGAQMARRGRDGVSISDRDVAALDRDAEEIDATLPPLGAFILPGGGRVAAHLHVARTVCRRAEREAVRVAAGEPVESQVIPFLNRLSLVLFAMARQAAHLLGTGDELA